MKHSRKKTNIVFFVDGTDCDNKDTGATSWLNDAAHYISLNTEDARRFQIHLLWSKSSYLSPVFQKFFEVSYIDSDGQHSQSEMDLALTLKVSLFIERTPKFTDIFIMNTNSYHCLLVNQLRALFRSCKGNISCSSYNQSCAILVPVQPHCEVCNKNFKNVEGLSQHRTTKHPTLTELSI